MKCAYTTCMWVSVLCRRYGQRVAISQVIALGIFFFSGLSPLNSASSTNAISLIGTDEILGAVNLLLFGVFILLFDRLTGRDR